MAHEIYTNAIGRASMAYIGQTPWHGLGQALTEGAPIETWQHEAGLDWEAKLAIVRYMREIVGEDGQPMTTTEKKDDSRVIYRSDTGEALSVVSDRYRPVQPKEVIEFYRDLTERYGFVLETAGVLKGGRKIWALAKTGNAMQLRGRDDVNGYLLLATSFDGSMATQARFTAIRVVCNNTLSLADRGRADCTVPHSTTFDANRVKLDLKIGDAWAEFAEQSKAMASRIVSQQESVKFFMDVYFGLTTPEQIKEAHDDEAKRKGIEKTMQRLTTALFNSPGAHMESARGMLWGLVNAVTYDVDHAKPARSQENRLDAAWFGLGAGVKDRAYAKAVAML